jgi:hypothetical protein
MSITNSGLTPGVGTQSLWMDLTAPPLAGDYQLTLLWEDDFLTSQPIAIKVVQGGAGGTVAPEMCLVQMIQPVQNSAYVETTDITVFVLMRDEFGGVLTDKDSETVVMNVQGPTMTSNFNCVFEPQKLYVCRGWAAESGTNTVSVTVNGSPASTTTGTPPTPPECVYTRRCSTKCPCMQQRDVFSATLHVDPYPV